MDGSGSNSRQNARDSFRSSIGAAFGIILLGIVAIVFGDILDSSLVLYILGGAYIAIGILGVIFPEKLP